jgi:hypothetical protein
MTKVSEKRRTGLRKYHNVQFMVIGIKEFLEAKGFHVDSPAVIKGKSGVEHKFDIVAYKGDITRNLAVIDVTTSTKDMPEQPVIAMFAKIIDVSPDKAYLIVIPRMTENSKKLAKLYDIEIIEAKNQKEAIEALEKHT